MQQLIWNDEINVTSSEWNDKSDSNFFIKII